jgi:hypothetical protein
LNISDLLHESAAFLRKMQHTIRKALQAGDSSVLLCNMGKLFLEETSMFEEFHSYCVGQVSVWKKCRQTGRLHLVQGMCSKTEI